MESSWNLYFEGHGIHTPKYNLCSKSMHQNTRQVLDTKENLQERLVLATTEKRPKSTQYSHRKTPTAPLSAMSTSTETQSRGAQFMVFPHVIINAVERISKKKQPSKKKTKKNLRNICDTSSTIFSETPPISPLHPPCLQTSRYLSPKQCKRQTSTVNTGPEFFGEKNWTNVSSSSPPKKGLPSSLHPVQKVSC